MISRRFRKVIYVVMILAGLVLAAYLVMSTAWFRQKVEEHVIAEVAHVTGGRVEVRQFTFSPFIFQVTLHGFVLHGTEKSPAPPLFSADTVVMGISPAALYRQEASLRYLEWENAALHLLTNPNGSSNIPGPEMPFASGTALHHILDLSVRSVTFLHTDVFLNDRKLALDLQARNLSFHVAGNLLHQFKGNFSFPQLTAKGIGWSLPTTTLAAQFHFTRTDFTLDSLTWRSPGASGNSSLKLQTLPALQANISYSASGDYPQLARALRLKGTGAGRLSIEGGAAFGKNGWTLQGRVEGRQITIPSASAKLERVDFSANYSGAGGLLNISNLKISTLGGTALGTAKISIEGPVPQFSVRVQIRGFDMEESLRTSPGLHTISTHLPPAANIQGTVNATWNGRLNNFKSAFDLTFDPKSLAIPGSVPVSGLARGTAALDREFQVVFQEAKFQTPHSSVTAQGKVGETDSDLAVKLTTSDYEEWRRVAEFLVQAKEPIPLELKSPATFKGTITGPVTSTDIRGRVDTGHFTYRGWDWDSFSGSVGATRTYVEITSGRLRRENSLLVVDASAHLSNWVLDPEAPAQIEARAQRTPIEGLQAALRLAYPVKGELTGDIHLNGSPANLAGAGQFLIERGQAYQQTFDSFSGKIRTAAAQWSVDDIQVTKGAARLTGKGQYNTAQKNFSVDLHAHDFTSTDLKALAQSESSVASLREIEMGASSFDLQGHGTFENVVLKSTLDIPDFNVHGMAFGKLHAQLDWENQKLQVQLESQGEGGSVRLRGAAQTEGEWPAEFSGEYAGFRADPWMRLGSGIKFNGRATATGSLNIKGPLKNLNAVQISGQTAKLEIRLADMAWINSGPINLQYAQRILTARPFQMIGPSTRLTVEGSIQFADPAELTLSVRGQTDNTLLSLLDPALHATGRSELDLQLNGNPVQPLLHGTLKVHDLNLAYSDYPFHISGLNGEIELEGDRATAKSLKGQVGGGIATLSGFLTFAQKPRFDFQANLDQVRVQYPADFTSLLAGDLTLVGSTDGGQLDGDLTVRQIFASDRFNVMNLMTQENVTGEVPSSVEASSLASKIRLNVRVSSDPDVRLDTHDLKLVADVDLGLHGTLGNPVALGTIHILSGEAVIRGNRYRLDRGDITMLNPFRTQPLLDMQARTRIQRYDLTIDISGPIDQMRVAYRTDPPLPTSDVLSLLALGYVRNTGELATTNQSFSNQGASALLSEALNTQTTNRIQRLFGVSRIKIDPNVGDPAFISGTRVTIEQQVSHDLTITYATNTGSTQQRVIQFEWALSDRISLIGVRDQNGIFGTELIFRRRFK
ncbi:MAG TPA: translocation/assembly module TamB domain-containing protein [Terriglobia bacterium]|nr:translocation/assembly module TamB domain-containing protein [Terriglobia bacterium]